LSIETKFAETGDGRPLVANDGPVADAHSLRFMVKSILPESRFTALCDHIVDRVSNALPASYELITQQIEAHVDDSEAKQRFRVHSSAVERTRRAYDPSIKENWKAVYWPNPSAPEPHGRPVYGELPFGRRLKNIDKTTAIGSAGSCFAQEIMKYLTSRNYNYVMTENNDYASACWGPQYNAIAFQQTVEWAFGLRERPLLVWNETPDGYWDPFREGVSYATLDDVSSNLRAHRVAAREALTRSKVFVLTIGLNEVWWLGNTDTILARFPRKLASFLVRNEVLTVEQNVNALQRALDVVRSFNPDVRFIVTVSPVPLYATFQGDKMHVIAATAQAKAILRTAIETFADRNPDIVSYFPAMETVLWCTRNPWDGDGRHVSKEAVSNVMRLFEEVYLV
jgi:hypothetical protein